MRSFYIAFLLLCSLSHAFAQQAQVSCGTSDEALPKAVLDKMAQAPLLLQQQNARLAAGEMYICRIAIDIDYQTYLKYDGDTNLITRKVMEDIQKVSEVYEREINTRMVVSNVRIFKNAGTDPYGETDNIFSLLSILTNMPTATREFDKRAYFYTKPVTGAAGVAYISGATSVSALGYPQLMMHEFGHNFGSPHTHNCGWPGGPIDYCSSIEGSCYDKSLEALSNRSATIMSYCAGQPTFHPLCQAVMRDHANAVFTKMTGVPNTPQPAREIQVSKGDFLFWTPSTAALSYEIMYSSRPDFTGSKTVSVPFNGFLIRGFETDSDLFVRIRAINGFGASEWSESATVRITAGQLPPPEIAIAETPPIFPVNVPVTLSYPAVPGATSYEVQVAHPIDLFFQNLYVSIVSNTSEVQYNPTYAGMVKWRVRAINAQGPGKWSETGFFSINATAGYGLTLPFNGDAPTTFPFSYGAQTAFPKIKVSVADNPELTNPLFTREYKEYGGVLDVVSQLPPNSKLFFRVEEWNESMAEYPKVKLIDHTFSFNTGGSALPANLTFLSGLEPDVFNQPFSRIALTSQNLWTTSPAKGFVRVNQNDLSYEVFDRQKTNGLIGLTWISPTLQVDDSLKIHIMSSQTNTYFRRVELPNDNPSEPALVRNFYFGDYLSDYDPTSNIYWSQKVIYKENNTGLSPIKTFNGDWVIRKVVVMAGKMWALVLGNWGNGEIIVMDMEGTELEKISSDTHPDLLTTMEQFVISPDGKMMIMQYDQNNYSYRISLWDKNHWTVLDRWNPQVAGGLIQAIASSPAGEFYAMVSGEQTRILKYDGNVWEPLTKDILLRNLANNIAVDVNDHIWLTGQFGIARLTIPQFDLIAAGRNDYCANDSITVTVNATRKTIADKVFAAVLKKSDGASISVSNLSLRNGQITFKAPGTFTGKGIELQFKTVAPEMYAPTSLRINIHELPTAKISISKSELIPLIDTATITVDLTGEKPWTFFLTPSDSIFTELSRYTAPFLLTKQADFDLYVTRLADKNCATQEAGNTIRVTAMQITGVPESQCPKVSVYPNPSLGEVVIEHEQQNGKSVVYHLSDPKGVIVDSKQSSDKLIKWDISNLNAGSYILWTVHNGNKRSWKIVKN